MSVRLPGARGAARSGEASAAGCGAGSVHGQWAGGDILAREQSSEFGARAQAELQVDAVQVLLDGLRTEKERGGSLTVAHASGDDESDLELLRRQSIRPRLGRRADVLAARAQLCARALAPWRRAEPLERRERSPELLARRDLLAGPPKTLPEGELGASACEGVDEAAVPVERLGEMCGELVLSRHETADV